VDLEVRVKKHREAGNEIFTEDSEELALGRHRRHKRFRFKRELLRCDIDMTSGTLPQMNTSRKLILLRQELLQLVYGMETAVDGAYVDIEGTELKVLEAGAKIFKRRRG
jgi:hypothetical protein